jgi:putative glutamine amidotransferase
MTMATRPRIGMCTAVERASWRHWNEVAALLLLSYVQAVERAGAVALMLPPQAVEPDDLLAQVDGLLLAGGADVDPASYGAEPEPETTRTCPPRDAFEIALARRALELDMPLLGICRGMQLMNVAAGGTLVQHVDHEPLHRRKLGAFGDHDVELEPGSLAARAVGAERSAVKSHHHQGIGRLADGFVVTGHSPGDGLAEAMEEPSRRFALGVLWHPEADEASRVIEAFVHEVRDAVGAAR